MTRKGVTTEIISVSLPKDVAEAVDKALSEMGYKSRSEFMKDAARAFMRSREDEESMKGTAEGVMIIVFDHRASGTVSSIRHRYMDIFKSFMHSDFFENACRCCEVLIYSGDANKVRRAYGELRSAKHVEDTQLFMASKRC